MSKEKQTQTQKNVLTRTKEAITRPISYALLLIMLSQPSTAVAQTTEPKPMPEPGLPTTLVPAIEAPAAPIEQEVIASIVGGQIATDAEAANVVSLRNSNGEHISEGLVIGPNLVAFNLHGVAFKDLEIFGGDAQLDEMTSRGDAQYVYTFPDYTIFNGDIAVIQSDKPLNLTQADLVDIPGGQIIINPLGQTVTMFGHGPTELNETGSNNDLMKLTTTVVDDQIECPFTAENSRHFCMIGSPTATATQGDSGGKVINQYGEVLGLTSSSHNDTQAVTAVNLGNRALRNWFENIRQNVVQPDQDELRDGTFVMSFNTTILSVEAGAGLLADNRGMNQKVDSYNPKLFRLNEETNQYEELAGSAVVVYEDGSFSLVAPPNLIETQLFFFANECAGNAGTCVTTNNQLLRASVFLSAIAGG